MKFSYRKNKVLEKIKLHGKDWFMNMPMDDHFSGAIGFSGHLHDKLIEKNEAMYKYDLPEIRYFSTTVRNKAIKDFSDNKLYKGLEDLEDTGVILLDNEEALFFHLSDGTYTATTIFRESFVAAVSTKLSQVGNMVPVVNFAQVTGSELDLHPLLGLPLLMLYHLAETETKIADSNKKKQVIGNEKVYNDTSIPIELINSDWFTTIIRTEGFGVKGHFGIRACGPGRSERRLTWIKPHVKNGYVRKAKLSREAFREETLEGC